MAYTTSRQGTQFLTLMAPTLSGDVISDATAQQSFIFSASAGAYRNIASDNNTGFNAGDIGQAIGSGVGGLNEWYTLDYIGVYIGAVDSTKFSIRQPKPIATSVTSTTMTRYIRVLTRFAPTYIKLLNVATLDTYEWYRGMDQNTAIKTAASGAKTKLIDSAIVFTPVGFWFHPSLIGLSNTVKWNVNFDMPEFR
jgi:hypothetical protein